MCESRLQGVQKRESLEQGNDWGTEKGLSGQASCEKSNPFHCFLGPYEGLSLGQWPGEVRNHLTLFPQLARIQTDTVVAMLKALYPGIQFEISKFS